MSRFKLGVVVTLAALVTACGGGGDGEDSEAEAEYVAAVATVYESMGVPADQIECAAGAYVDVMGVDRLQDEASPDEMRDDPELTPMSLGIELEDNDGDDFFAGFSECLDPREFLFTSIGGGDPTLVACLDEGIDDETVQQVVVAAFLDAEQAVDSSADTAITEVYSQCAGSLVPGAETPPADDGS